MLLLFFVVILLLFLILFLNPKPQTLNPDQHYNSAVAMLAKLSVQAEERERFKLENQLSEGIRRIQPVTFTCCCHRGGGRALSAQIKTRACAGGVANVFHSLQNMFYNLDNVFHSPEDARVGLSPKGEFRSLEDLFDCREREHKTFAAARA